MKNSIIATPFFLREFKRLKKKYPSLQSEYEDLVLRLQNEANIGISIGNNCYKIRIAIVSKGKGKRGGARIITNVKIIENKVFLITIYDKSEQANISDKELKEMIKSL